jgi:hypothetical protein
VRGVPTLFGLSIRPKGTAPPEHRAALYGRYGRLQLDPRGRDDDAPPPPPPPRRRRGGFGHQRMHQHQSFVHPRLQYVYSR